MTDLPRPLRSVLYLPASNARALEKARTLPCDAVILDLEDAVAPAAKEDARRAAVAAVDAGGFGPRLVAIRANGLPTPWSAEDFAAIAGSRADAIVVPKVDTVDQAAAAVAAAGGKPVWAMIESPLAVLNVAAIAATPGVAALVAGTADLAKDLRAQDDGNRTAFLFALSAMVNAARAFGIAVLDGMHPDIADEDGLRRSTAQGAMLGFDGRTLIHPAQIAAANDVYSPGADAIADAHGLIAAHEEAAAQGKAVAVYKGKLVEVLHVAAARRLLALHAAIAARDGEA